MKTVKIHDVTVMAKFDKAFGADRPIAYSSQATAEKVCSSVKALDVYQN